ncbi:MAG: helix-turn-helix domain-containing protein [Promethearchaeota archaeon]
MERFIDKIKHLREEKKLTLEEISKKSRININYLKKLESGDFGFLPFPYVKGIIKTYAKYIGISLKEIEEKFDELREAEKRAAELETTKKVNHKETDIHKSESGKITKEKKIFLYVSSFFIIVIGIIIVIGSLINSKKSNIKLLEKETFTTDEIKNTEPKYEDSLSYSFQRQPFKLEIVAKETTWVGINVDIAEISNEINKKYQQEYLLGTGNKVTVEATDIIEMRLGKSEGVDLFLNGEDLGIPGPRAVLNLIITSEGIKDIKRY